jgi:hypothetical protein
MNDRNLLRIAAAMAVTGGALRIADALLTGHFSGAALEPVYFLTDVLFLGGLLGLYLPRRDVLGWAGLASFALAAIGFLIIRSASLFGGVGYILGASLVLGGTTALGVQLAIKGSQRVAAGIWLAAFAIAVAGSCCVPQMREFDAAGMLYGIGFVAAGIALARQSAAQSAQTAISTVT